MRRHSPISTMLTKKKISVQSDASLDTIHILFRQFPEMEFMPVENRGKFIGVIYRYEFLQTYLFNETDYLTANDLININIVYLSPDNTIAEAADVFESEVFNQIPIVNEFGDLVGILGKEDFYRWNTYTTYNWQTALRDSQ